MTRTSRKSDAKLLLVAIVLLAVPRIAHLTGPIDEPHAWRQCDTAQYARAFYEDGFDLLRPSVNWMGPYKTVILEFPLIEAIMAAAYHVFGPRDIVARLVVLAFFAGSAAYLFLIMRSLVPPAVTWQATWIYLVLPLALYYSRAVHVDFGAVFFGHAMAYHTLAWSRAPRAGSLLAAMVFACLGYLVKAPYLFYLALPIGYAARARLRERPWALLPLFVAPAACFLLWRRHAEQVNAATPDWSFLPGYHKFVDMGYWYFGRLSMRWEAWAWWMILPRLVVDVAAIVGVFLVAIGVSTFLYDRVRANPSGLTVIWLWCVGAIAYLMIFFNLNRVHDYYQIPFLAPAAVLLALGIDRIARAVATRDAHTYSIVSGVAVAVLVVASVAIAETRYYRHDDVRLTAGEVIANITPRGALVIAAAPGSDPRDPQLLYYAHRYGWPIDTALLTIPIVHALQKEGATHLAVLGKPPATLGDVRRLCIEPIERPIADARLTVCALRSAPAS